jgi:hypothetical protein
MSANWIKMRTNLWDDPRVAKLCDLTEQGEAAVIGGLYWLWAMADAHTANGILPGLTCKAIDRKTGVQGLGDALCEVGWLADHPEGVRIISFEEHNGASAKKRCQTAKRVSNFKTGNAQETHNNEEGNAASVTNALPERYLDKIRIENTGTNVPAAKDRVWTLGPALLGEKSRGLLGKLVAQYGEDVLADVLSAAATEEPGEPKAWIVKACEARSKQQAQAAKLGGYAELFADPKPQWALDAGFANRFEANNDGCFEHNAAQFRDGKKVAA